MTHRDWYSERDPLFGTGPEEHAMSREVGERLSNSQEFQDLTKIIRERRSRLTSLLQGEAKTLWHELEDDLGLREMLYAKAHYNIGVESGLAVCMVDDVH